METVAGLKRISEVSIPDVNCTMLNDALAFHAAILQKASMPAPPEYAVYALKGLAQPTTTSVRERDGRLEGLNGLDGTDWAGDGTVPRVSSHPTEWQSDADAATFGQQHATLQSDTSVHRQLFAILTASQIQAFADSENLIGLDLPPVVHAGEPLPVRVASISGDTSLPLRAHVLNELGKEIAYRLMRNVGEGRYEAVFDKVAPGQVFVRIASATPRRAIDPVTGVTVVWDERAAGVD